MQAAPGLRADCAPETSFYGLYGTWNIFLIGTNVIVERPAHLACSQWPHGGAVTTKPSHDGSGASEGQCSDPTWVALLLPGCSGFRSPPLTVPSGCGTVCRRLLKGESRQGLTSGRERDEGR